MITNNFRSVTIQDLCLKSIDIEGLLVRPLAQALMVYRTVSVQKHTSYASVVETGQINTPADRKQSVPETSVVKHCVNM